MWAGKWLASQAELEARPHSKLLAWCCSYVHAGSLHPEWDFSCLSGIHRLEGNPCMRCAEAAAAVFLTSSLPSWAR